MKVTLTKNIGKYKAGDDVEVTEGRKRYWEKLGVIGEKVEVNPTAKKVTPKPETKASKPDTKKLKKIQVTEKVKK